MSPKIYVIDVAAEQVGVRHGGWIDAHQDLSDVQAKINELLSASPVEETGEYRVEELADFGQYEFSENSSLEYVCAVACLLHEHPEFGIELLANFNNDVDAARHAAEDYCGCYESEEDFAREMTEQSVGVPESLQSYIDYKAMARDMRLGGDIFVIELRFDEKHIFWRC